MSELAALRLDLADLRKRNEDLVRQAGDAELALAAFARGEVDALALESSATPVLLQAAQQQLRASQHLLRSVFDSSLDPSILVNNDALCVDCNPAACTLFGRARDGVVGHSLTTLIVADIDVTSEFAELLRTGRRIGHFALERPDGSKRMVECSAVANAAPQVHFAVLRDVTERVAAEASLRRSEALFRAVIEKSAEVISLTAADGTTRYLTPSAWTLLGWNADEVGQRTLRDQVIPEDRVRIETGLAHLISTGERDMSLELRVTHRDGSLRWVESTATNLLDDPNVNAIVGNYRDITTRKTAEAALRASRDQLEEAQAIAHVGSWVSGVGPESRIEWSRECDRIYGLPPATPMTVAAFYAFVHPDDRERMHRTTRAALDDGAVADIEHRIVRPDGEVRRLHQRGVVERDAAGHPIRMVGTLQDITERHDALELLRESEQRYRRIVETTTEGVWMYDAEGITTFMNAQMARMLGCTVAETVGKPMLSFMQEVNDDVARERTERRHRGISDRSDHHLRRKDGTVLWASIQVTPLFGTDGAYEAALCLVSDVSAERSADAVRAHLAAIVESSDDAIVSATLDGTITSWNRGAEILYQYSAKESIGTSMSRLLSKQDDVHEQTVLERVARGEACPQYETSRVRKDGSSVEVAVTLSPVHGAEGRVIGVSRISRDLTARRAAEAAHHHIEEQFRQVQKMEAVGRLAGGVAHDFNNVLTVILSYAEMAIQDLKPGDPLRDDILQIRQSAQRAGELTAQLLAFSRQQVLQPQVVGLDRIVEGMKLMLRRLLGEDVTLSLIAPTDVQHVLADPGQIEQVVMNLAINARDAMPDGGVLTIETSNIHLATRYGGGYADVPPGDYVLLAVTDTGTGMDAATRTRIFEPFFTTKAPGKGTGLGLSTVFGIVQQSGGYLGVTSALGHGTRFEVYFPLTQQAATPITASEPARILRGTETILLVEDEEQVRAVGSAILRRNGYHVVEAANGGEAILLSQDYAGEIDLLLTDVVMPRMNGRRLREQLETQRPHMKVLYTSGYTDDAVVRTGVLKAGVAFLQKPFTTSSLLRKVRDVLG